MMKMMKILSLLVCVVCLCVLPGAWAAQRLTNQVAPAQSPTQGLSSGVANVAPASLNRTAPGGAFTCTPAPLPEQKKASLINDVRAQSGKKRIQMPPSINEVVLSPSKPSSGNSWLACVKGTLYARPPHGQADLIPSDGGQYELEFAPLRSGSFYLVDCVVESYAQKATGLMSSSLRQVENAQWSVTGTQERTIAQEDGHMYFSFRAGGSSAHFVIKPRAVMGRLYRVELTRVP